MKRLFSFMMAVVLVLSLSVTAFAAEDTGSITITNATKGEEYRLYHIFDATYSVKDGEAHSVLYTINKNNTFFEYMFGADGTKTNPYFSYTPKEGSLTLEGVVAKKDETVQDEDIIKYLTDMVREKEADGTTAKFAPVRTATADSAILTFDNLPYGYYLIDKNAAAFVTIDSNTPTVKVIDKNQIPGQKFDKLVKDDNGNWVEANTASVGDMVEWKVEFIATNYNGEAVVQYYAITDEKSSPLWVEFDKIQVFVDGDELKNGYYYCANNSIQTNEWQYLGEWTSGDPNDADWYLIHYTYDKFEIVIPWMDDFTFTGKQDPNQGYELEFDMVKANDSDPVSESKFASPVKVELLYKASVGPDAAGTVVENSAHLDYVTPEGEEGPDDPEKTKTSVYNLGVTKISNDGTAEQAATRLAGAVFELYTDAACTQPIYVIPTNNTGVYILDDVDTNVTGNNRITSREKYVGHWENYITGTAEDPNPNGSGNKRQDMTTPANGQLVIMGLEAGTYYLKETKAPEGYNILPTAKEVKVGPDGSSGTYSDPNYKDLEGKPIQYAVSKIDVVNSKGLELPSTGGEGTMMLITIGTMVAMAFAVLLITHKKMSIYHD